MKSDQHTPQAVTDAYQRVRENPDSLDALTHLRRVLLMEAGRLEKRITLKAYCVGGTSPKATRRGVDFKLARSGT